MPIALRYDPDREVVMITVTGSFGVDEFVEAMATITSGRDYPPTVPVICDASRMAFDHLDQDAIASLSHVTAQEFARRGGARTAYVCPHDLGYGMLRMLLATAADVPGERRVVRSLDDALAWLGKGGGPA